MADPDGNDTTSSKLDPRRVSVAEAARWLGIDRGTLTKWIRDRGAPLVREGSGRGDPTLVSVPDLVKWQLGQAVAEERALAPTAEVSDDETQMTKDEAERRRAVADALRAEIRLAKEAELLVPVADVGPAVAQHLAPVRQRLMSLYRELPDKLERRTGIPARVAGAFIRAEVDACLADIAKDVSLLGPENEDIPDADAAAVAD